MEEASPKPRRRTTRKTVAKPIEGVAQVNSDDAAIERLRNGQWKEVLEAVGAEEYNRLRLLAAK